jgi:hypothetical protein
MANLHERAFAVLALSQTRGCGSQHWNPSRGILSRNPQPLDGTETKALGMR